MNRLVENTGSTCRDFCMLERNLLSHLKLALLLSLMASSLLLDARLVPVDHRSQTDGLPLACVQFLTAIAALVAGVMEYSSGYIDLRHARAFFAAARPHFVIMGSVTGVVFGTCITLLATSSH